MATPSFDNARAMIAALTPSYPVYCLRPAVIAAIEEALDAFDPDG